jgi:hypothetical protein
MKKIIDYCNRLVQDGYSMSYIMEQYNVAEALVKNSKRTDGSTTDIACEFFCMLSEPLNEPDFMVVHKGYKIDIFTTENGSLGLTVERCDYSSSIEDADNRSIDIFVDRELKITTI